MFKFNHPKEELQVKDHSQLLVNQVLNKRLVVFQFTLMIRIDHTAILMLLIQLSDLWHLQECLESLGCLTFSGCLHKIWSRLSRVSLYHKMSTLNNHRETLVLSKLNLHSQVQAHKSSNYRIRHCTLSVASATS
jgi:hypothetical protein